MSIRERLDDARILWAANRKEGAILLILCSADATAEKRYPGQRVGDRFRQFIRDEMGTVTGGPKYNVEFPFDGKVMPLEDIFYEQLRCMLVHEGALPGSILLTEPVIEDGKIYNVLSLKDPLGFPINFALNLFRAIWDAPENSPICGKSAPINPANTEHLMALVDAISTLGLDHKVTEQVVRPSQPKMGE